MGVSLSGLASGFDWQSLVEQLAEAERVPQKRLQLEQDNLAERNTAYASIVTQLNVLRSRVAALNSPDLFQGRLASVSDAAAASATAFTGALPGAYEFHFTQLATAARRDGLTDVAAPLSGTDDVSALALSDAAFATAITAGRFTVNGVQITVAADDTLGEVLQNLHDSVLAATGQEVTAGYDHLTDRITLHSSTGPLVLGSATDTSNFLDVAQLHNNGLDTVSSAGSLGSVRRAATLANAHLATAITFGGTGTGRFRINGTEVTYTASDTVTDVLKRINDLATGVTAGYDAQNDRFVLTNEATGDLGVALEDVDGNFLSATGLAGGQWVRGKDLLYTVNGGGQLRSHSNTITEASSGLAGLSVTALKSDATTTVNVASDTARIKTAINDFLTEYNKVQSMIDTQTASSTDGKGKVTAGVLAAESDASELGARLRGLVYSEVSGLSGALKHLDRLGIVTNGQDNRLTLEDSAKLDAALTGNLSEVQDLFTHQSTGLAARLDEFLEKTVGDEGSIIVRQTNLTKESAAIDTQIADLERLVQGDIERMTASFIAMETAQAQIKQQLQYLQQQLGLPTG